MKNYYDDLEVGKKASKEVIEKVYKILAKKYHPDTTQEIDKQAAEEKFKEISEAYQILSDEEKRRKYDIELEQSNPTISYEDYINVVNQRDALSNALNKLKSSSTTSQYNHIQYNKVDIHTNIPNKSNNNYNRQNHTSTDSSNQTSKAYYYTNTRKPISFFDNFKHRAKEFFTNLSILLLSILAAILIFNVFSDFNLFNLFIK